MAAGVAERLLRRLVRFRAAPLWWAMTGVALVVAACLLAACSSPAPSAARHGSTPSPSLGSTFPPTVGSTGLAAPTPVPGPGSTLLPTPGSTGPVPSPARTTGTTGPGPSRVPAPAPTPSHAVPPPASSAPAAAGGGPGTFPPTASGVLDGKVVAIDPGHNGRNYSDPSYVNHLIFNGREQEACDTTGTETDSGYTESLFNWNVAQALSADLRAEGATVVLTRTSNNGVGPCVTDRAAIGNNAHASAAVSIHADGGPASGRGFAILEPVADGPNDAIIGLSQTLGTDLRNAFASGTGEPVSNYDGASGIQARDDLGGTNLSTVPKVFVECANMRNATDAALVTSSAWQAKAAEAIATGLTAFLTG
ncbi:MAG: N-acetylmuramoyl-L-alanine amidase [Actinomycetota bacterium]